MNGAKSAFERVAGGPLRALTKLGSAELTERLGLRAPGERLVYEGAKAITRAAKAAVQVSAASRKLLGEPVRLPGRPPADLFDLTPTEEQELLAGTARRFADEVLRPRAAEADRAVAAPDDVLEQGHALGLAPLAVPEALGGAAEARSATSNVLVIEELARGDMGLTLALLSPLAVVGSLVDFGTKEQQERLLPRFLGERFVPAAFALLEPRPQFDPMRPETGAVRTRDGGWELYGEKSLVPLGESAEVLLIAAEVKGAGPRLFLVEKGAPGLSIERQPAMGLRAASLARLRLSRVRVGADALLGGEEGAMAHAAMVQRARIAWGAMATGTARAVLDYVIPYCNDRRAFGEPISQRQAVAFMIADMAIELEGMRLLVQRAASLSERGKDVAREASMVRVQCAAKAMKIGTDGVGLLGGHGFIKEHPVERWYRDLRAIGIMEGAVLA
jgi:alkylation response protein AidB-like acyl-CoA dehydrogenase